MTTAPLATNKRYGLIKYRLPLEKPRRRFLTVQEQEELITWEVSFKKPECASNIDDDDPLPAFLPYATSYPCLSVTVKVRDPGGLWSNAVTRVVKRC